MTEEALGFEVVEDNLREQVKQQSRPRGPLTETLLQGKTIFVPGKGDGKLNAYYEVAKRNGKKLTVRTFTKEGTVGHIAWFIDEEAKNG